MIDKNILTFQEKIFLKGSRKLKKFTLAIVTIALTLMLAACGSDKDELVGLWVDDVIGFVSFEFQEDGTLVIGASFDYQEGTYEVKGSTIVMDIGGGEAVFDYAIEDEQLILTLDGESQAFNKVEEE